MPKTCAACDGSRRVQRKVDRAWWQVLLHQPGVLDELCPQCGGVGVVKGSPEEEREFAERRQRKLEERRREAAVTTRPDPQPGPARRAAASATTTTCVITCQIPADIVNRIPHGQTRAVLGKCAAFAGNPVVDRYDINSAHRQIMCVDSPPSVVYEFTVHAHQGLGVAEAMRGSWRELMDDIRRAGIQALMRA